MSAPRLNFPYSGGGGGGGISGSGTAGKLAKFTSSTAVGDSLLSESGTTITSAATAESFTNPQTWTLPANTAALNIGGNAIQVDALNKYVGINAPTGPAVELHVGNGTSTYAGARYNGICVQLGNASNVTTSDGTRTIRLGTDGTNAIIGTTTAHDLLVQTNGATKLFVQDSTGNVGIGTTNPLEKLAVSAGANDRIGLNVSGTVSTLTFGSVGATAAIRTIAYDRTSAAWTFNYGNNPGPLSTALTIDNSGVSTFGAAVRATGTSASAPAFTGSDTDTGIYFPASNQVRISTNSSPALSIDASQNVGISNTAGTILGKLHVGSGTTAPVVTTPGLIVTGTTSEARLVVKESTVGAEWFVLPSTTQVSMGNVNAYNLEIKTNNAARLIVGSTGIVTVGATAGTDANTLDVSTSGWGVKLNGSPTNVNPNTLDCYEEGTWTPVDRSGAGLTFTAVSGTYTRVGRTVTAQCTLTYPSTANTTDASFSLPIAMTTANTNFGGATIGSAGALVKNNVTALIKTGATPATDSRIALITYNGAGTVTNANMSLVTIVVSVCYNVA